MLEWTDVQFFLGVARAGSLQRAAEQLDVDRTTISRRLLALEARLGSSLFTRSRRGLSLTAAGEKAVAHASAMAEAARAFEAEATPSTEVSGLVRIATTDALAALLVEQGLWAVAAAHPGLSLEVLAGNRKVDLEAGEADVAVRLDPLAGARLKARCLDRSRLGLYAARRWTARNGVTSMKRLSGVPAVLPAGELAHLPEAKWLRAQGVQVVFSTNSVPALVAAAREGAGLIALSDTWGAREPLLERLGELPLPARAVWAVMTEASAKRAAVKAVVAHLVAAGAR